MLKQFFDSTPSAAVGEIGLDKSSRGKKIDFTDQVVYSSSSKTLKKKMLLFKITMN